MRKAIKEYFEYLWKQAKNERKSEILRLVNKKKQNNLKLLDLGCDNGDYSLKLGKRLRTNAIYGIEINQKAANEARKKGIEVKTSDLNKKFPFRKESFDIIVADQVIEHLHDLDNFASEIKRTLKPDGIAVVSTENLASWHNVFALLVGHQPFTGPTPSQKHVVGLHPLTPSITSMKRKYEHTYLMPPHTKVLSLKAMKDLFKSYNFRIDAVSTHGYLPLPPCLSSFFEKVDPYHAFFITIRIHKDNKNKSLLKIVIDKDKKL